MSVPTTSNTTVRAEIDTIPLETVPLRHPGRLAAALALLLLAAAGVLSMLTNERFGWDTVLDYLFRPSILTGMWNTVLLTAVAMTIGIVLGTVLAICRMSQNPVLKGFAGAFLWFFRGTPLLVQLVFWFNLSALYPRLGLSVPFTGDNIISWDTNVVISVWVAAILGFGLNEAAYMAEIIRSGLLSVVRHQREAARALGMSDRLVFFRVIWPQALRVIVPPTGNQVIGMLKHTSLVSIIALPDLMYSVQLIYSQNFQTIPLLVVASIWYLVLTTLLSLAQSRIEKHYGKGVTP
jgi:polar amino acid transport system permease protein